MENIFSDGSLTRYQIFGCLESANKWFYGKLKKAFFFIFCRMFGIFNDFSKFPSIFALACSTLKNHQILCQKIKKNMFKMPWTHFFTDSRKSLNILCKKYIYLGIFRVLNSHLAWQLYVLLLKIIIMYTFLLLSVVGFSRAILKFW